MAHCRHETNAYACGRCASFAPQPDGQPCPPGSRYAPRDGLARALEGPRIVKVPHPDAGKGA